MTRRALEDRSRRILLVLSITLPIPAAAQDSIAVGIRTLVADGRVAEARWPMFSRYADKCSVSVVGVNVRT